MNGCEVTTTTNGVHAVANGNGSTAASEKAKPSAATTTTGPTGGSFSPELRDLLCHLYDVGAVKFGNFKLKSGMESPVYFDLRVMVTHPEIMSTVSELLWSEVSSRHEEFSLLCGVPYNALPLATLMSVNHNVPMLIRRKEVKSYGTKKAIEGIITPGARCLIVEDVISSGGSILETVAALEKEGAKVDTAVVFLDRQQGAVENLRERHINVISVITMSEMMELLYAAGKVSTDEMDSVQKYLQTNASDPVPLNLPASLTPSPKPYTTYRERVSNSGHPLSSRLLSIMDDKRTNLAFSADVRSSKQLLELVDLVGPHICLLKTHVDIMTDFTMETAQNLQLLAKQHNFLIMEDRKFCDIGNTVKLQYSSPALHFTSGWAELVTSHALSGPGVMKGLKEVAVEGSGCVVVIEMSSEGSLTSSDYVTGAVAMAIAHPEFVVGVVSRHRPTALPPSMVVMTPGVKLQDGVDSLGQSYITPERAVGELGSDIIIVGRGIYSSPNVMETAKQYKERGYSAYLQRIQEDPQEQ